MKYRNLLVFFVIVLFVISCESSNEPIDEIDESLPSISIEWNEDNSIVCLGTSITNGKTFRFIDVIISPPATPTLAIADSAYPTLLAEELKIDVHNYGVWGAFAKEGITRFHEGVLDKNPCFILLEFGANEFLRDYDVDIARSDIESQIRIVINHDIKIALLSFVHPDMLYNTSADNPLSAKAYLAMKYYEMLKNLADEHDIPFINHIYKDIWGNENLMMSDGLHPNNKGNVLLKKNVFNALYKTFEKNGMLK